MEALTTRQWEHRGGITATQGFSSCHFTIACVERVVYAHVCALLPLYLQRTKKDTVGCPPPSHFPFFLKDTVSH